MKEALSIEVAADKESIQVVRELLMIYAELRSFDKALGDFDSELRNLPGYYTEPMGSLLLAKLGNQSAGVVAIRRLSPESCEMKRLFVRPKFRGHQIGYQLVERILEKATQLGYQYIYLDTHPSMKDAERMYLKFGFEKIAPYNQNPTPGIKHFRKLLL